MTCRLCGGGRLDKAMRSQDCDILRCGDCGLMVREPYRNCTSSKCAACEDRCIDRLADPGFLAARLRVDGRRAERIIKMSGGDISKTEVLELGSGLGCLGAHLSAAAGGYQGLEQSPVFYRCLLENFPQLNGRVAMAALPDAGHAGRFGLLTAVDVLQFAPDPLAHLKTALAALAPGGKVYIEAPDESLAGLRARVRKTLGLYSGNPLHHGHINFFTARSLRALVERAGLRVESLSTVSIAGDEDRLFLTLKRSLSAPLRALSRAARLTGADTILGLGNMVCLCSFQPR